MQTKGTKFEETAIIIRQEEIADDIYSMWLRTEHIAAHAKACLLYTSPSPRDRG